MNKITYLLGAGASCNALPMAKDFAERLSDLRDGTLWPTVIKTYGSPGQVFPGEYGLWPRGNFGKLLVESLDWLGKEAKRHASIDTYAKKLFIKNDKEAQEDLYKLKATLSCYLLLEQSLNPADKRYDSFFASILKPKAGGTPSLPDDMTILTWNYDTQLEKSYKEFCENPDFVYEGIVENKNIVRLNGVCGNPYETETKNLCHIDFSKSFFESVLSLFENQMNKTPGYNPFISFAWEKNNLSKEIENMLKNTTTLVIIGYSLPYFNRDIDGALFESMAPSLERIFIQVPESNHQSIQERFLTLNKGIPNIFDEKIYMLAGTDLFYIPDNMPG